MNREKGTSGACYFISELLLRLGLGSDRSFLQHATY